MGVIQEKHLSNAQKKMHRIKEVYTQHSYTLTKLHNFTFINHSGQIDLKSKQPLDWGHFKRAL